MEDPEISTQLASKPEANRNAIELWRCDLRAEVDKINQKHLQSELIACRDFFQKIEKSTLTEEQAKAVVYFDNRVLVIASIGSGKTSAMVAKAGYDLRRGLVTAHKILLLAFNADATKELQSRILERQLPLWFPTEQIVAKTFHAFGLEA